MARTLNAIIRSYKNHQFRRRGELGSCSSLFSNFGELSYACLEAARGAPCASAHSSEACAELNTSAPSQQAITAQKQEDILLGVKDVPAVTTQKGDALIPAGSADQPQDSTEPQTTLLTKPLQLASAATDPILTHLTSKPSH